MSMLNLLEELGYEDIGYVLTRVAQADEEYAQMDQRTSSFIGRPEERIRDTLKHHLKWFVIEETFEQSVFLYLSLAHSDRARLRVVGIQDLCTCIVGENDFRPAPVHDLHVTVFTDVVGDKLEVTEQTVLGTYQKYRALLDRMQPIIVHVGSPRMTPDGGVILACEVYSSGFYRLRDAACASVVDGVRTDPRVPKITYAAVGYVTDASPNRLQTLTQALDTVGTQLSGLPVYVRELGVIKTRNKAFVNPAILVKLCSKHGDMIDVEKMSEFCGLAHQSGDKNMMNIAKELLLLCCKSIY